MESYRVGSLLRLIVDRILETVQEYEIEKTSTIDEYNKRVMYINGHIDAYKNVLTIIDDASGVEEGESINADEGRVRSRAGSDSSDGIEP